MKRSTDRILTSHAGSLSRPEDLIAANKARIEGISNDEERRAATLHQSVADVVKRQAELGVDVVNDGEFGKASRNAMDFGPWQSYTYARLSGWELADDAKIASMPPAPAAAKRQAFTTRRDWAKFPRFYEEYMSARPAGVLPGRLIFTGDIKYTGQAAVKTDVDNLKAALAAVNVEEGFVTSVAPGSFARGQNYRYGTDEEYLYAIAEAMREEYRAIIDAGFVLQLDDPALPDSWDTVDPAPSVEEYKKYASVCIEALNHGLRDLPADRIRYHICWGSWQGPHTTDIPLKDVADLMFSVRADAFSIEAANVQHEHEYRVWGRDIKLPEGKIVMPGVVTHKTNVVEHPELIAERLVRYANAVGRENVIAETDCGLGGRIHDEIAWAKIAAMVEGAALASKELWGR